MEVGRSYRIALIAAVLAAGGYVGLTQIRAAEGRADARAQAAESLKAAAEAKVFQAKAEALLAKLPRPVGFTPTEGAQGNTCQYGIGVSSCFLTAMTPRPALDAYLHAVRPLGLVIQKNDCVGDPQCGRNDLEHHSSTKVVVQDGFRPAKKAGSSPREAAPLGVG